jgi:hypothetical protein
VLADDFFRKWLSIVGYDGCTIYMHMVGAGHVKFYLKKWRNLNRNSNQGWEYYNKMFAAFWHHRTTKGGNKNDRSKIRAKSHQMKVMMMLIAFKGNYLNNIFSHEIIYC